MSAAASPILAAKQALDDASIPLDSRLQILTALTEFLAGDATAFPTRVPSRQIAVWRQAFGFVSEHIQQTPQSASDHGSDLSGSSREKLTTQINGPKGPFQDRVETFTGSHGQGQGPIPSDASETLSSEVVAQPPAQNAAKTEEEDDRVLIQLTRKQWKILAAWIQAAVQAEADEEEDAEEAKLETDTEPHQSGNEASDEDHAQSD
jgi:hypothetical protein